MAKTIAFHLGNIKRDFESGKIHASEQCNADETHLLVGVKTKKILCYRGATRVKYQQVVSGSEGMTVVITIKGGDSSATVSVPMVIFPNDAYNYPLVGVRTTSLCYRTQPQAFMDGKIMREYYLDRRTWGKDITGKHRDLWMDN